jgi:hypothetical protein
LLSQDVYLFLVRSFYGKVLYFRGFQNFELGRQLLVLLLDLARPEEGIARDKPLPTLDSVDDFAPVGPQDEFFTYSPVAAVFDGRGVE